MHHEFEFRAERQTADGIPIYEPGEVVEGHVMILPDKDAHTRGIQMWIGCHIHGSGTPETIDLQPEGFVHQGDLQAGVPITASFQTQLPLDSPLSYQGRRVKFDWQVRLRVDIPIWPDKRTSAPFVVVPRRTDRR